MNPRVPAGRLQVELIAKGGFYQKGLFSHMGKQRPNSSTAKRVANNVCATMLTIPRPHEADACQDVVYSIVGGATICREATPT